MTIDLQEDGSDIDTFLTLVGPDGQLLAEKANSVLLDEIVCVSGYVDQDGRMIADDVIFMIAGIPMKLEKV